MVKGKDDIVSCMVSMVLSEWPSGKMVTARLEGRAKVKAQTGKSAKDLKGDAEACVTAATEEAAK